MSDIHRTYMHTAVVVFHDFACFDGGAQALLGFGRAEHFICVQVRLHSFFIRDGNGNDRDIGSAAFLFVPVRTCESFSSYVCQTISHMCTNRIFRTYTIHPPTKLRTAKPIKFIKVHRSVHLTRVDKGFLELKFPVQNENP